MNSEHAEMVHPISAQDASVPLLYYLLCDENIGDRFLSLSEGEPLEGKRLVDKAVTKSAETLKDFESGHLKRHTYNELTASFSNPKPCTSSSVKVAMGSARLTPELINQSTAPESSCPSLETDDSKDVGVTPDCSPTPKGGSSKRAACASSVYPLRSSSHRPAPRDSSEAPATTVRSSKTVAAPESSSELEPPIIRSIRRVLSKNLSYAEQIISAVKQLPHHKRNLLFISSQAGQPSQCDNATTDDSAPPSQDQPPQAGKQSGISKPPAAKSKKRPQPSDDSDDDKETSGDGDDDGHGGGKVAQSGKKQKKSDKRWACPYCLAYPHILGITRFSSCRPPGFMKKRSDWRDHLKKYHSPEAKLKDPLEANAQLYMDAQQWQEVQDKIVAADQSRPRLYEAWFEIQKTCFLAVWRIIFPKRQFPSLQEPVSPFHPDSDEIANLAPQGLVLFDAIFGVRARQALETGSVASVQDFRPSHQECIEMMSDAFAIVANNSPGVAQWVANAPPQTLQAAVEDYTDQADTTAPEDQDLGKQAHNEPTPESGPSELAPLAGTGPQDAPPVTFTIPLFPAGTQITMQVSSSHSASPRLPACLHVTMPATFYPQLINQVPITAHMYNTVMNPWPIATTPPSSYDSLGPANAEPPELLGPTNDQSLPQVVGEKESIAFDSDVLKLIDTSLFG